MTAVIQLRRESNFQGSIIMLHLYIDGAKAGDIADGAEKEFAVESGTHQVQVKNWTGASSPAVSIDAAEGAAVKLLCGMDNDKLFLRPFSPAASLGGLLAEEPHDEKKSFPLPFYSLMLPGLVELVVFVIPAILLIGTAGYLNVPQAALCLIASIGLIPLVAFLSALFIGRYSRPSIVFFRFGSSYGAAAGLLVYASIYMPSLDRIAGTVNAIFIVLAGSFTGLLSSYIVQKIFYRGKIE